MLHFSDFSQVFVFTTNHHLNVHGKQLHVCNGHVGTISYLSLPNYTIFDLFSD